MMEGLTVIEMTMLIVGSLGAGYMIPEVLFYCSKRWFG